MVRDVVPVASGAKQAVAVRLSAANLAAIERPGKMALIVLAALTVFAVSVAASLAGNDMDRGSDRSEIVRCSLDGVNPAHHPQIFGNPAVAAA